MTIELFMFLFTIGSLATSLLTEALKKTFANMASNLVAAVSSIIIGLGGTLSAYLLLDIEFSAKNITCLLLMATCIWIGATVGYDKVKQTIDQIKR